MDDTLRTRPPFHHGHADGPGQPPYDSVTVILLLLSREVIMLLLIDWKQTTTG